LKRLKTQPCVKLSRRQKQVLALLEAGNTTRQIAERLAISERAVMYHITTVRQRLGASSRAQIVALLVLKRVKPKSEETD
jgi:DNA-binding CsgD family transcriptional regulator